MTASILYRSIFHVIVLHRSVVGVNHYFLFYFYRNESCDLDSAICSLVFAHHLNSKGTAIPMLNIPKGIYLFGIKNMYFHEIIENELTLPMLSLFCR